MKVFFPDLSRLVALDCDRPGSLPLVREATVDGLRAFGHETVVASGLDVGTADLALVDAVDAPSRDMLDAITELRGTGVPIVVRLHGAWTAHDPAQAAEEVDPGEAPVPLRGILDAADRVIVSSRSHLVRLASAHAIDADRVKLLAPPVPEFEALPLPAIDGPRRALLIGERDSLAYDAAGIVLADADLDVTVFEPRPSDGATVGHLRSAVENSHVVAVAAAIPWSDRALVEACVALGRPVVAATGPVLDESPPAAPVLPLPLDATEEEWADGITRALAFDSPDLAPAATDGPDERLRRLTAILFEAAASGGDWSAPRAA